LNCRSRFYFANNRIMSSTHCSGGMKRNVHIYAEYKASCSRIRPEFSMGTRASVKWKTTSLISKHLSLLNVCCDGPFF
jgi:hypothetical protein